MIEITNLTKTYDRSSRALKNVNITIEDGEFVFITGRSGSGKSTLLKILLKEVEPTSGRVIVNDMDLGAMPRRYVPKYRRMLVKWKERSILIRINMNSQMRMIFLLDHQ